MFGDRENDYTDVNYWDKRFEDEAEYEWIANFDQCSRLIVPHLKPDHRFVFNTLLIYRVINVAMNQLKFWLAKKLIFE